MRRLLITGLVCRVHKPVQNPDRWGGLCQEKYTASKKMFIIKSDFHTILVEAWFTNEVETDGPLWRPLTGSSRNT